MLELCVIDIAMELFTMLSDDMAKWKLWKGLDQIQSPGGPHWRQYEGRSWRLKSSFLPATDMWQCTAVPVTLMAYSRQ